MNRRLFLTGAGVSTAYVASRGFSGRKAYAQSGGLDPNITNAASTNSTITTANCWNGVFSGDDWRNLTGIHALMRQDVQNKGLDSAFVDAIGQVENLDPSVIDLQQLTSNIQVYQPSFQLSDMVNYFNMIPKDPTSLSNAMNGLRQGGLSGHLSGIISQCRVMAGYADTIANGGGGQQMQARQRPLFFGAPPPQPKTNYNCQTDGALSFFFGTAMIVIAIMAGPAGVLAFAFWEGIALWGGIGAGVWSAGHVVNCGF